MSLPTRIDTILVKIYHAIFKYDSGKPMGIDGEQWRKDLEELRLYVIKQNRIIERENQNGNYHD